jgi:hypothetical protein
VRRRALSCRPARQSVTATKRTSSTRDCAAGHRHEDARARKVYCSPKVWQPRNVTVRGFDCRWRPSPLPSGSGLSQPGRSHMRYVFRAPAEPPGECAILIEAELIRECRIGPSRGGDATVRALTAEQSGRAPSVATAITSTATSTTSRPRMRWGWASTWEPTCSSRMAGSTWYARRWRSTWPSSRTPPTQARSRR